MGIDKNKAMNDSVLRRNGAERSQGMSDEELASLMTGDLGSEELQSLLNRLENDPAAIEVVALALSQQEVPPIQIPDSTREKLLGLIRRKNEIDLCPFCANDLHITGDFCPHCSQRARGNILYCVRCAKPVPEEARFCSHCGAIFRKPIKMSIFDNPLVLLVPGLISLFMIFIVPNIKLLFVVLACLLLGAWAWEVLLRYQYSLNRDEKQKRSIEKIKESEDAKKAG